jgi:hypothetical protein
VPLSTTAPNGESLKNLRITVPYLNTEQTWCQEIKYKRCMIGNMSRTIVCNAKLNCIQDFVSHTSKFPILYYFETISNLQQEDNRGIWQGASTEKKTHKLRHSVVMWAGCCDVLCMLYSGTHTPTVCANACLKCAYGVCAQFPTGNACMSTSHTWEQ